VSSAHESAGAPARVRGPLTGLAPEAKIVGLVAFLVVVAVTPPSQPAALLAQAVVAAGVAVAALVDPRDVGRRLLVDLPLLVLAATMAVAGSGPRVNVVGLHLSQDGLRIGVALLAKAGIAIVAVSAVAASTSVAETVGGLRRLRLPAWCCEAVALTARQLDVLRDQIGRLRLAGSVRAGTRGARGEWSAVGRSLGVLFVRSMERMDQLQLATAARGGTRLGATVLAEAAPAAVPVHWLVALLPAAAALVLRLALTRLAL
jgi:cobalt/nickel transport system permease protein